MKSSVLSIRVDPTVYERISVLLAELGLTASAAVTMFFQQMLYEGGIPFEAKRAHYSLRTLAAMQEGLALTADSSPGKDVEDVLAELKNNARS